MFSYTGQYKSTSNKIVTNAIKLRLNRPALSTLYTQRPEVVDIVISLKGEDLLLHLRSKELFSYNRPEIMLASNFKPFKYSPGYYLQGSVEGKGKSVVALSLFDQFAGGIISFDGDNYTLALANSKNDYSTDEYVLYADKDYHGPAPGCTVMEDDKYPQVLRDIPLGNNSIGCPVDIHFEIANSIYNSIGSAQGVMDYFTILFNGVQALYNNENLLVQIRDVTIWDTPDPENGYSTSSSTLYAFSSRMQMGFNGDLAHYITFNNLGGGIAWLGVLCRNDPYYKTGVSGNLVYNYAPFPNYSYSVKVITHETGHNFGSPHTHSCTWPGGPIDGCAPVDDGPCTAAPMPGPGGGTIMSYCHTKPGVGVNFANGFGPLPGNLIRTKAQDASDIKCICTCSDIIVDITTQDIGCGNATGSATATVTQGAGPFTYLWSDGSTTATASNLPIGTYYVKVTGANGKCTVIKGCKIANSGNALGVSVIPSTTTVAKCINESHTMSVSVSPAGSYNYQWYNNGVAIAGATTDSYTATTGGTYHVEVNNGICVGQSALINISIQNILPFNITVGGSTTVCENDSVQLSIPATNYAVDWMLNGNVIPGATGSTFFAKQAGSYTAKIYSSTNPACSNTASPVVIQVQPSPLATINPSGTASFCYGEQIILQHNAVTGTSLQWWKNNTKIAGETKNSYTVKTSGTYYLTVTAGNNCVSKSATVNVSVSPLPDSVLNPTGTVELCNGGSMSLRLSNPAANYSYKWFKNQQEVETNNLGSINVNAGGGYSVLITDLNSGCHSTTDTTNVIVIPPPVIFAGNDTVISTGQPYQLNAREISNLGVTNFEWTPVIGLNNSSISNPVTILNTDQVYIVKGIHPSGCFGLDSLKIKVFKGPAIYVPKAFSPNGDGLNDILKCVAVGLNRFDYFEVYDRLGHLVFRTTNPVIGWDGTIKGTPAETGAYIWTAKGMNFKGALLVEKGTVMVVR